MRWLATTVLLALTLAGCGGGGTESTPATSVARVQAPPSGPIVRICDRSLQREVRRTLRSSGVPGAVPSTPTPAGTKRLSSCDFGKVVEISMDGAPDAVQRYQNRITESAQFAVDNSHFQPRPIRGVGSKALGAAGANWLPWLNQLISARGKRVLIVNVNTESLPQLRRLEAAKTISLAVYERL